MWNVAKRVECGQLAGAVASREPVRKREQAPHTLSRCGTLRDSLAAALLRALCILSLPGTLAAQTLNLPARPTNALSGTEFIRRITPLALADREKEVFVQVTSGNVPDFLRRLCPVHITNVFEGKTNSATFFVTPDYLAVGSDEDYFLTQISPNTAQKIADTLHCALPTRKMVNDIYSAAEVKLAPSPIAPSPAMTTVPVFSNHNAVVRAQRTEQLKAHPLGALVAGHQKDVVIAAGLASAPGKVAIYGWHQTNGVPIQPLYLKHSAAWVDYSQCSRLVHRTMTVNGTNTTLESVLADPELCALLSDEGTLSEPRYPTNDLPPLPAKTNAPSLNSQANTNSGFTGFHETNHFKERIASFTLDPEVKVLINAPHESTFSAGKQVLLVLYALPNGNTTEQTIGRAMQPGDDWHFDIQHIGAQTRFLRALLPERLIVVVYLENNLKSWPAWRRKHGDRFIPEIVEAVKKPFATNDLELVLSGHSGGGSFIFGYLNTVETIPNQVVRIAFLDSNYAYDRALGHTEKLTHWLRAGPDHFLCLLAYNDAVALLDGKPFVSAAGGTWGKSHEMQRDLAEEFKFTSQTNAGFERSSALERRVQFILKENPDRKIFHTVQVERNGYIHSMVSGTTNENKGYEYFGERAYSKWIEQP